MSNAEILRARTALAQQMGQKAEAMRVEAEQEMLRTEGALGAMADVIARLGSLQAGIRTEVDSGELELEQAQLLQAGVTRSTRVCEDLQTIARDALTAVRGRLAQAERTLDMMEAVFTADVAAANVAVIKEEARLGPVDEGRHPGPSIAEQRRAEEDHADPGSPGSDSL